MEYRISDRQVATVNGRKVQTWMLESLHNGAWFYDGKYTIDASTPRRLALAAVVARHIECQQDDE